MEFIRKLLKGTIFKVKTLSLMEIKQLNCKFFQQ